MLSGSTPNQPNTASQANTSTLSAAPSTGSTVSVTASAPNQQNSNSSITFKVLEDYINKWMADLDAQEKDFLNQATQLNALDKLMMENGEKVIFLNIFIKYTK